MQRAGTRADEKLKRTWKREEDASELGRATRKDIITLIGMTLCWEYYEKMLKKLAPQY